MFSAKPNWTQKLKIKSKVCENCFVFCYCRRLKRAPIRRRHHMPSPNGHVIYITHYIFLFVGVETAGRTGETGETANKTCTCIWDEGKGSEKFLVRCFRNGCDVEPVLPYHVSIIHSVKGLLCFMWIVDISTKKTQFRISLNEKLSSSLPLWCWWLLTCAACECEYVSGTYRPFKPIEITFYLHICMCEIWKYGLVAWWYAIECVCTSFPRRCS